MRVLPQDAVVKDAHEMCKMRMFHSNFKMDISLQYLGMYEIDLMPFSLRCIQTYYPVVDAQRNERRYK